MQLQFEYNRHTNSQQSNTMPCHLGEVDNYKDTSVQGKFSFVFLSQIQIQIQRHQCTG